MALPVSSFDPSGIATIGSSAPDLADNMGRAYRLKDLMDQGQLRKLELSRAKSQMSDDAQAREILKGADYSTPEGVTRTAEKLTRAGLIEQAKEFSKYTQQLQTGQLEQERQKLELHATRQDQIAGTLDQVYGQLEQLRARGMTPTELDAQAKRLIIPAMQSLVQSNPEIRDVVQQFASNPQNLTYAGIKSAEAQSNRGQAMIKQRLEELRSDRADRQESERERHDRAMEDNAVTKTAQSGADFGGDKGALLAALAQLNVPLPAGLRSKAQMSATLQGLLDRNKGKSVDEIAALVKDGKLELAAEMKATSAAAGIRGKVEFANQELDQMIPIARDASAAVDRGKFVPFTQLKQLGERKISDPDLKKLYVATQSILNSYDMLAARGGTDKDKRAANHKILETADSPEAFNAALEMIQRESQAAGRAGAAATKPGAYSGRDAASSGGSKRISSDADYESLPSGAEFIAPDDSHRRKP